MPSDSNDTRRKPASLDIRANTDDSSVFMPYIRKHVESVHSSEIPDIPKIRVVFMGTPDFAATILSGLLDAGYHVVAVYTKPDGTVGRKRTPTPSAVKRVGVEHDIPIEQPARFDDRTLSVLRKYGPDIILVAAYGKILPKSALDMPGFGCVNAHASLLPRYRGASPVQNSLLQGETETGITLMRMDEGLDTGDIISVRKRAILPEDTTETLLPKLADDALSLLLDTLPRYVRHEIEARPQKDSKATVCQLIEREDGHVFWNESAESIWNRYRGLSPWPGIFTFWRRPDQLPLRIKLTRISIQRTDPTDRKPLGEVFETGEQVAVQTAKGLVFIEELQPEGGKPVPLRAFLNGHPDFVGSRLG